LRCFRRGITRKRHRTIKTIALAGIFSLSSTWHSLSQAKAKPDLTAADQQRADDASQGTAGSADQNKGGSMPSSKDASTQGANTAGAAEKKGDATTPAHDEKINN